MPVDDSAAPPPADTNPSEDPVPATPALLQAALQATDRSVVISDPRLEDNPLVWVNPAFERLTGFSEAEVIGKNCRFLQGPDTDPAAVAQLRRALDSQESAMVLLLNYRSDGTSFWNEVSVAPLFGSDGELTHFVGVQNDVTSRVVAEIEREAALMAETESRITLESLLATAPVGLGFVDRELRFTRVNSALAALTGIAVDEHLGRSVDDVFLALGLKLGGYLHDAMESHEPVLDVELKAVPPDGSEARCWLTSFYPVIDSANNVRQLGVVFSDVTQLRFAEQERADLLEREQAARRDAEHIGEQLAVLAEAMDALADTMHLDRSLTRFLDRLVPRMADWCAIDVVDGQDGLRRVDSHAHEPSLLEWVRRAEREQAADPSAQSIAAAVFEAEQSVLVAEVTDALLSEITVSERHLAAARNLGLRSLMVVPVKARGQTIGVLSMARVQGAALYGDDDLALALELASRVGLAVDNARLYEQEHRAAETLQRALLPPAVPVIDGLQICVQYQPGADGAQVGGDWYDVVELEDGSVALSIGDVVGHDLAAAVRMSELRTVLRAETAPDSAYARSPATSVDRLDRFAREYGAGFVATLLHGVLRPDTGEFTYVRAGHLPLAIVGADHSVRFVDDEGSPPLGIDLHDADRIDSVVVVPLGATLVLYTDGLIERRGQSIDDGFDRLVTKLARATDPLEGWCDQLLDDLAPTATTNDDVAVLLARRLPPAD